MSPIITLLLIITIIHKRITGKNWIKNNEYIRRFVRADEVEEAKELADNVGEKKVRKCLTSYCMRNKAHALNHITLKAGDGTTEIDHILVSRRGIVVIETKHYKGWLFGGEKQKMWTKVIYNNKYYFQNPIHQNHKHILAVRNVLHILPKKCIGGIVVFTGDAEFKTDMPNSVIQFDDLEMYLKAINFCEMSEKALKYCVGSLEYERFALTEKTDIDHANYLRKKFGENE